MSVFHVNIAVIIKWIISCFTRIKYPPLGLISCEFDILQDENIPLLTMVEVIFEENDGVRAAIRFIILIGGCIALVGR